ncbi:hypothetical protein GN244_ATG11741 [Phytophthora infestans]|uniref:Uncharacterized protein n=1 Tax=Phytophthora infestans TaxID=4787 RepID=A0A833SPH2_PHYIN|nr:hypothetical protein GN244_ATG11741 [Phytophthora infestans]
MKIDNRELRSLTSLGAACEATLEVAGCRKSTCLGRKKIVLRPTASGAFRHTAAGAAVNLTFDMRRILSIPPNAALPPGVSPTARVDLRIVMNLVIDSLE